MHVVICMCGSLCCAGCSVLPCGCVNFCVVSMYTPEMCSVHVCPCVMFIQACVPVGGVCVCVRESVRHTPRIRAKMLRCLEVAWRHG